MEYLLKWVGYDELDWQVPAGLNWQDKIEEFEQKCKVEREKSEAAKVVYELSGYDGFDNGFEPDRILGITDTIAKERMFLMKWKSLHFATYVSESKAKEICPEIVIKFFAERAIFGTY